MRSWDRATGYGLGRFMTQTPPAPQPVPWALRGERGAWLTFGLPVAAVLAFLVLSPKK